MVKIEDVFEHNTVGITVILYVARMLSDFVQLCDCDTSVIPYYSSSQ